MLSIIIPTRDRPEHLALTLAALGALDMAEATAAFAGVEVIVVDNASRFPPTPPATLPNGAPLRLLLRSANEAAAARNAAALAASGSADDPDHWLLMLDDDSAPLDTGFVRALADAPADVAAVGAEIFLEMDSSREAGGLPEVFVGCGAAIRRSVFLELHGYDPSFGYYAEEYDLAARMILAGHRVVHDRRFRVLHRKAADGRDINTILRRLVRNNAWIVQRYAPEPIRQVEIDHALARCRDIAERENALAGYEQGLRDLDSTLASQPRREMPPNLYDRFTGLSHARDHLRRELARLGVRRAALVAPGKHAHLVERAVRECNVELVDEAGAEALVIATLSPGPMLDALDQLAPASPIPVLTPWRFEDVGATASEASRRA